MNAKNQSGAKLGAHFSGVGGAMRTVSPPSSPALFLIDYRAVAAAELWAQALRVHVGATCRRSALYDFAQIDGAQGIACHAIRNVSHPRSGLWFARWQPVAIEEQGSN